MAETRLFAVDRLGIISTPAIDFQNFSQKINFYGKFHGEKIFAIALQWPSLAVVLGFVLIFFYGYLLGLLEWRILFWTLRAPMDSSAGIFRHRFHAPKGQHHRNWSAWLWGLGFTFAWFLWPQLEVSRTLTLFSILLTAARTDTIRGIIPNGLIFLGVFLGLLFGISDALSGFFFGDFSAVSLWNQLSLTASGGLLASAIPLWLGFFFELFAKRQGIGLGDVKLFGVLGLFFGCTGTLWILFCGAWIAIAVEVFRRIFLRGGYGSRPFPFAPYILFGAVFYLLRKVKF
jgi:Flp pilus assembly protein protease CpaA